MPTTRITLDDGAERFDLLCSFGFSPANDDPHSPDEHVTNIEVLRVELWLTWSELLGCYFGFTPDGLPPRDFAPPDGKTIFRAMGPAFANDFNEQLQSGFCSHVAVRLQEQCLSRCGDELRLAEAVKQARGF